MRVLPDWQVESLPLAVLWPRERHVVARVRAFVEWVVELYVVECREAARAELASRG